MANITDINYNTHKVHQDGDIFERGPWSGAVNSVFITDFFPVYTVLSVSPDQQTLSRQRLRLARLLKTKAFVRLTA